MDPDHLPAFRLGDVRGVYPGEINDAFSRDFAIAFAREFGISNRVAIGRDMRDSSQELQDALSDGFMALGIDVIDLGLCTTELGYFASAALADVSATLVVTASHNPPRYNGFKCVLRNGEAITFESGLDRVMQRMLAENETPTGSASASAARTRVDLEPDYIRFLHKNFSQRMSNPGPIALNGLNGTAATLAVSIADQFELPVTWFRKEPGPIPDEGADPSNPRLVGEMKTFMEGRDFALGVVWDGDCDRCVFFDGNGELIPTYYVIGLLAGHFLTRHPGRAIVFDTKLCWNTQAVIAEHGGIAVPAQTGHAFMKKKMREHDAIYGGELSSHHFFGDFFYCDSGMHAWLTILEILSGSDMDIGSMIETRRRSICCTPEVSFRVDDADAAFASIENKFAPGAARVDHFDGPSFEMPEGWRFTLRKSKTEPLIRLNFESREGAELLLEKASGVTAALRPFQSDDVDLSEQLVIQ